MESDFHAPVSIVRIVAEVCSCPCSFCTLRLGLLLQKAAADSGRSVCIGAISQAPPTTMADRDSQEQLHVR